MVNGRLIKSVGTLVDCPSHDPTADFLNHDAVVLLAVAVAQAGLENVGVYLKQREPLAGLARLIEHELRILESLAHPALWGEIPGNHFRSLGVHHLRGRSRHPGHVKEGGRFEAKPGGKYQAFGERQAVEAEDQIDSELGPPAVADLADMKTPRKQRMEHRRG